MTTARSSTIVSIGITVGLVVLAVVQAGLLSAEQAAETGWSLAATATVVGAVGIAIALWWRVRYPFVVVVVVAAIALVTPTDQFSVAAALGLAIASYSVARWEPSHGKVIGGLCAAALAPFAIALVDIVSGPGIAIVVLMLVGTAASIGRLRFTVSQTRSEIRSRELAEAGYLAAAAERERIAHEMHDSIAHTLTVVSAQATGAQRIALADPERAAQALSDIAEASRRAQRELRVVLGLIDSTEDATAADLPGLLAVFEASGLALSVENLAVVADLPVASQVVIYQIVRESLTNAMKHGDLSAGARVTFSRQGQAQGSVLTAEITNTISKEPWAGAVGAGRGIAGMQQRMATIGGSLSAGSRADSIFEVTAQLPLVDNRAVANPSYPQGQQ